MRRFSTTDRAQRRQRFASGPGALAGVLGALAASEAMARERIADEGADSLDAAAPVAASLEDILGFAEICRARGAFAASWSAHEHDWFAPRFVREGLARFTHDDHAVHAEHASGAHRDAPSEHGAHAANNDPHDASAAPDVMSEGHDAHASAQEACDDMPVSPQASAELSPEHAGHFAGLVMQAADFDESLAALLAASHYAYTDDQAGSEAEGMPAPENEPGAASARPLVDAAAHLHHHEVEAIVVSADI